MNRLDPDVLRNALPECLREKRPFAITDDPRLVYLPEVATSYIKANYSLDNCNILLLRNTDIAGNGFRRLDEAIAHYQKALEINPDDAQDHNNLGTVMALSGRLDEAIVQFRKALELKPDFVEARKNLGVVQSKREEILKALAGRRESLRSRPDDVALLNDTAWTLATNPNAAVRNGTEAVELAQRAVQLSDGRDPAVLGTLAAAYAEAGKFPEAVKTAERALTLATSQNNTALAETLRTRINLYQAGFPYRDAQQSSVSKSIGP